MRTGADYIASLSDDRSIYVDGERVADVATHPAYRGVVRTVASLFDHAADPANGMQFEAGDIPGPLNRVFMIPRSREDLAARREAITAWAELTHGWVGRSPDHVGGFLAGFAGFPEFFDRDGRDFSQNVTDFYRRLVTENLYVSYVIIPPQIDRSATPSSLEDEFPQVGVAEEREDGIVIRGAQMLGTASAISDYIFVSCIKPLAESDERYAVSFVVPTASKGLKLLSRRPYAVDLPSEFDYPLSSRFDESDALVTFEDVFVPWSDVFVYRDVGGTMGQWFATAAHVLGNSQAQIRLVAKIKFLISLARKIAAVNGIDRIPSVVEKLGELASLAAVVEGMTVAAEAECVIDANGVARPNPRYLYGVMGLQAELYPRCLSILRELSGAGMIQLPATFRDVSAPETAQLVQRYICSPGVDAEERIKLFKLAWDAVGSEFAGRHHQYEMFYAGAPFVSKGYAYRNYGYDEVVEDLDRFLRSYGAPVSTAPAS
ncbi:MAG TPA: 4-hydroxyphenylacetate 3-hydroxylase N-terminal domain-containing protein [Solirubrobacterales bacterium]|nr:4-hydroxyphenylacetate 3-hydroxylase N-terminal domain-containing protein [Solirubrobacterales bacterium]